MWVNTIGCGKVYYQGAQKVRFVTVLTSVYLYFMPLSLFQLNVI